MSPPFDPAAFPPFDRRRFLRLIGAGAAALPGVGLVGGLGDSGLAAAAAEQTTATGSVSPSRPPAVPLAVRSPYVSTWLNGTELPGSWESFWDGATTALCGMIRVDGHPFLWAGAPSHRGSLPAMTQESLEITPTRSIFTLQARGVRLSVEWLSPVEPGDIKLQSIPLSLLTVTAEVVDGRHHTVQVYADVSGEWASGVPTDKIEWSTSTTTSARHWSYRLADQQPLTERGKMAGWGTVLWSTSPRGTTLSYESGQGGPVRDRFITTGVLTDTAGTRYRAIDDEWPVFAYAHDLGMMSSGAKEASFSIGHARTPAVSFLGLDLLPLWSRYWSSGEAMAADFLAGASGARSRATTLDAKIKAAATRKGGADYAALCALSLRQTYGACELVVGPNGQPWAFLKEISSGSYVSTVDVICPAMPVWLTFDPDYLAMLLDPVLAYASSSTWTKKDWAPHDLGPYPTANSTTGGYEQMPIEETGGMLIMAAAYAARVPTATAKAWLAPNTSLWAKWATYLIGHLPDPPLQLTTDDFAGPIAGSVNLAIKGIIGLGAAAQIATLLGDTTNATTWGHTASTYAAKWLTLSTDPKAAHLDLTEGGTGTWGDLYNPYCDTLLGTGLVPATLAASQAAWYASHLDTYGLSLQSTTPTWAKADWMIWTAAWLNDYPIGPELVSRVAAYLAATPDRIPFDDFYNPTNATEQYDFRARPVVGAMYALLALP